MGQQVSNCRVTECQRQCAEKRFFLFSKFRKLFCEHHRCQYKYSDETRKCHNMKDPMFDYCSKHRCDVDSCSNQVIGRGVYHYFYYIYNNTCKDHVCFYCKHNKKPTMEQCCQFCQENKYLCVYPNCDKSTSKTSNKPKDPDIRYACKSHRCSFCTLPKNNNSSCCDHHTCQNADCNLIAEFKDGYCPLHLLKSK